MVGTTALSMSATGANTVIFDTNPSSRPGLGGRDGLSPIGDTSDNSASVSGH